MLLVTFAFLLCFVSFLMRTQKSYIFHKKKCQDTKSWHFSYL